ncbi:MAG: bifunctional metallophosphatase/5'-nucleotidase [Deltaproteobacteria bacterium]|nr:bifunctional metallophosphatase/5'-nucleotidase [Deltaproteobacteria bacterium]
MSGALRAIPILWPLLLLLLSTGCSTSSSSKRGESVRVSSPDPDEVVLVATADLHAALERAEGLASVVRALRAQYGNQMLHLDGGDLFQGTLEGNLSKGKSIVAFYNLIGLDAAAIGNHDLDYGPAAPTRMNVKPGEDGMGNLKQRVRQAKFKWLSANIVRDKLHCRPSLGATIEHCNAQGNRTIFEPHAAFQRAGRKVCVIGATTPTTTAITRAEYIKGTRFDELAPVIAAEAAHLRDDESCDLVVLTVHAGLLCTPDGSCRMAGDRAELLRLLPALPPGTLDAVVAGHTHMLAQETINDVPVIEAGTGAKSVGVLHLRGTRGNLRARFEPFIPVPEKPDVPQPDVTAALKPFRDEAARVKSEVVGRTTGAFPKNYVAETALGNLVADVLLDAARRHGHPADFAITNAGGLRGGLPAGSVTYGDVFNALPFDNALAVVELKGSELRALVTILESGGHGVGPVSGLRVKRLNVPIGQTGKWSRDLNGDGKTEDWERDLLLELTDDAGTPIDPERTYRVATPDFLVWGGDHEAAVYDKVPNSRKHVFPSLWERDLVVDFLRKHGAVNPSDHFKPDRPRVTNVDPR